MPLSRPLAAVGLGVGVLSLGAFLLFRRDRRAIRRIQSYFGVFEDEGIADVSGISSLASEQKLVVLGLDGSGKSVLLSSLAASDPDAGGGRRGSIESVGPTTGVKVTTLHRDQRTFHFWEVGGGPTVRPYWSKFVSGADVLVFVVDSADQKRFAEAGKALKTVLSESNLGGVPLVVVANKQDVSGAADAKDVLQIAEDVLQSMGIMREARVIKAENSKQSRAQFYQEMFALCDEL